ncbi:MAG: BMC domain-containing protein [Candidatus Heimdallarchaeota archaeon]|nr:MAG: BMC domain-containing protein [Candidatus Heimdallarchaeota archaeon]
MSAIGIVETNVIARGVIASDAMAKAADIKLLVSTPVCPGKYLIIIQGTVASVKSALAAGDREAGESLTGSVLIPNVHPEVFPAISGTTSIDQVGAIGMIETYSAPSAVMAADEAVKSAKIRLIEIRLSRALGGKAFALFTGDVGAVRAAIGAGVNRVKEQGLVLSTALIPAPHKDLVKFLL